MPLQVLNGLHATGWKPGPRHDPDDRGLPVWQRHEGGSLSVPVDLCADACLEPARRDNKGNCTSTMAPLPDPDTGGFAGRGSSAVGGYHEARAHLPAIREKCQNRVVPSGDGDDSAWLDSLDQGALRGAAIQYFPQCSVGDVPGESVDTDFRCPESDGGVGRTRFAKAELGDRLRLGPQSFPHADGLEKLNRRRQ